MGLEGGLAARGSTWSRGLAGLALIALLAAGYVSASFAAPKGPAAVAVPQEDTEPPPTQTGPAPDPAPPRTVAPKPAPKPAPKRARVYHAPVTPKPAPTPTPTRSYTPPAPVVRHAKKQVVHKKKHKKRVAQRVSIAPKPVGQVKHANVVKVAGVPAASVSTDETDQIRRTLVITGVGIAGLLFLLVVVVPATAARFTAPGRIVMDHQTDFVLAGIALLVLTALLFAATGRTT